jgi:hypothetical protein
LARRPSWPLGRVARAFVGSFELGRDIRTLQQGLGRQVPVPAPPVAQPEDASQGGGGKMQLGGNGLLLAAAFGAAGA